MLKNIKEETVMQQTSTQEVAPINRIIDRHDNNTFTEYILSRPVTLAHKCEDIMAGCSSLAVLCGLGCIGAVACPEYIPANEQVALGFLCAMGVCMTGTVLSGIAGGISDYFAERKKQMLQAKMEHTRD
jgi:hypothetical protein